MKYSHAVAVYIGSCASFSVLISAAPTPTTTTSVSPGAQYVNPSMDASAAAAIWATTFTNTPPDFSSTDPSSPQKDHPKRTIRFIRHTPSGAHYSVPPKCSSARPSSSLNKKLEGDTATTTGLSSAEDATAASSSPTTSCAHATAALGQHKEGGDCWCNYHNMLMLTEFWGNQGALAFFKVDAEEKAEEAEEERKKCLLRMKKRGSEYAPAHWNWPGNKPPPTRLEDLG